MASQASNLNNNWFNSGRSSSNLFSPAPQPSVYTQQMPEGLKVNEYQANSFTPSQNTPTLSPNAYAGSYYTPNMFNPNSQGAQSNGTATTTSSAPTSTAPANTQSNNPYNLVPNLWNTNVTAGTVNPDLSPGPTRNLTPAGTVNSNYPTEDAAKQAAQMFGGTLYRQNMSGNYGPAGTPSAPMYGLDFGMGDVQDPGYIITRLARGDKPEDIMAGLQAGIFSPYGLGIRDNMNQYWDTANPLVTTNTPGVGTLTAGKTATVNPGQPLGGVQGIGQNNPFYNGTVTPPGNTGLTPITPTTPTTPTSPTTPQSSAIDWSRWLQLLNSLYYPVAEGANTSAFAQNITPAMQNTSSGNSYLPQATATSPGATGSTSSGFGAGGVNTLLNLLRGGNTTNSVNPILAAYLQSLLFSPTMG